MARGSSGGRPRSAESGSCVLVTLFYRRLSIGRTVPARLLSCWDTEPMPTCGHAPGTQTVVCVASLDHYLNVLTVTLGTAGAGCPELSLTPGRSHYRRIGCSRGGNTRPPSRMSVYSERSLTASAVPGRGFRTGARPACPSPIGALTAPAFELSPHPSEWAHSGVSNPASAPTAWRNSTANRCISSAPARRVLRWTFSRSGSNT